jgi:hypothetical protein
MAKVEENYELTHYQDLCSAGISDIRNVCDDCDKKLLDETGIAESWLSKDKKGQFNGLRENILHREESKI